MLQKLIKQSAKYFIGLAFGKVLSTITFILLARALLTQGFGTFTLFITLIQVITFFGDIGLNQWYQKHADHENKKNVLHKLLFLRLLTLIISIAIGFVTFTFSTLPSQLLVIFLLTLIPEAFLSALDGFYLERRQSFVVSFKTVSKTLILLCGYIVYTQTFSVEIAIYFYALSSLLTALWYFPWSALKDMIIPTKQELVQVIKETYAYAFLIVTSFAYSRGDALVIGYTVGTAALGTYGAAYRYLDTLSLIPTALAHNLFSISAKKTGVSYKQLLSITALMTGIGCIVSTTLYLCANLLTVQLLGKDYILAVPLVQIFAGVVLLFFINSPLSTVVQSSRFVTAFLPFGFINTAANIILNLIFIPIYGLQAAAWIMFGTELTGLIINLYFVKKIYN